MADAIGDQTRNRGRGNGIEDKVLSRRPTPNAKGRGRLLISWLTFSVEDNGLRGILRNEGDVSL